ncbi:MAG: hypothetical protein KDB53_04625 [Planctomycetes bacterium]|nr:hypothetical protein [Planctomycetota bacterium]
MRNRFECLILGSSRLVLLMLATSVLGQVHYHEDGQPWKQRANHGDDAEVDGWYYNLGITGLRVQLLADAPTHLLVKHVFGGSPAHRKFKVGDVLTGVAGQDFATPHQNGYGMEVFGAAGPIGDFAAALEDCQSKSHKGKLTVSRLRDGKTRDVTIDVGTRQGVFADSFPSECPKSEKILDELCKFLVESQRKDGSWGSEPQNTFAPLALMATDMKKHRRAILAAVRFHANNTQARDQGSLINWQYMAAGIVLGEYYLQTGDSWVEKELEEIRDFILWSQYTSLDQVNPKVKESHPNAWPKNEHEQHGGWGHNPGFEGYGPICMITGQGALTLAMLKHCGLDFDRRRHDSAYEFLARGTGKNGYVWYEDEPAGHDKWADMGRTGAAGLANFMSPYQEPIYRERALAHARVIGEHPQSFPDTHGSPVMGMAYAALAAWADPPSFRKLMDANRWWFTLSQCHDGSFYYQPNRDNAGYGDDSRIKPSAAVALILAIPKKSLHLTGKPIVH